jgi:hypothetical protein
LGPASLPRSPEAGNDQTDTGFSSDEPADWQKVVVSVVVWPFLVAVSSIGRQVLPSGLAVAAPTGLADTTVGWAEPVVAFVAVALPDAVPPDLVGSTV